MRRQQQAFFGVYNNNNGLDGAVQGGSVQMVRTLLRLGADVNAAAWPCPSPLMRALGH
jgi:hypothetical protein